MPAFMFLCASVIAAVSIGKTTGTTLLEQKRGGEWVDDDGTNEAVISDCQAEYCNRHRIFCHGPCGDSYDAKCKAHWELHVRQIERRGCFVWDPSTDSPPSMFRRWPPFTNLTKQAQMNQETWLSLLPTCPIVWHIHIPKTAGTSVIRAMEKSSSFVPIYENTYSKHGRLHDWTRNDLLQMAKDGNKTVLVTAETGIDDLAKLKNPWFDHTCFFSFMRDPHEWVLSAESYMRKHAKVSNERFSKSTRAE